MPFLRKFIRPLQTLFLLALTTFSVALQPARAISEVGYQEQFESVIIPFLRSGEDAPYVARDGTVLSGVKFIHPHPKGMILVLPGRGEPWLKYGEVFYDLFEKGYSIISYDHRGQGLSPHLAPRNLQIGHIDNFLDYITDLGGFIETVVKPQNYSDSPLFLIAHSMGAAIAAGYLETHPSPFRAVSLVSPMFQIDTAPYPESIALTIVNAASHLGKSRAYAIGKGDYDPFLSFEKNDVTGSRVRFWMTNEIYARYPSTILGGPSNEWIWRSLVASKEITKNTKKITAPILMFQAGADQVVKMERQNLGCLAAPKCNLVTYPTAQHEILMEQDSIRDSAMGKIEAFFQETINRSTSQPTNL